MKAHRYANFFPMMDNDALAALAEDIAANGLHEPIVTYEGKILDGRNRFKACEIAGVAPRFHEYKPNGGPLTYLISENIHRRHLTPTQRATLVTEPEIVERLKKEAAERQIASRAKPGERADLRPRAGALAPEEKGKWSEHAAKMAGVGSRTVESVERVRRERPEIVDSLRRGEMSAREAEREVRREKASAAAKRDMDRRIEKRRKDEPRQVKAYLDALADFRAALKTSLQLLRTGDASPEACRFITRKHDEIRGMMDEMESLLVEEVAHAV